MQVHGTKVLTVTHLLTHSPNHLLTHSSVKEIHAKNCKLFSTEPLLWMSGCIGLGAPKMNKLNLIDFSDCPLLDPGLTAVVSCNNKLKYVNLQNCSELSDKRYSLSLTYLLTHLTTYSLTQVL